MHFRRRGKAAYEEEYFIGSQSPIRFGFTSIFYRVNAWFRFRRVVALIRKHGGNGRVLDVGCALGHSVDRFCSAGLASVGCDISAWAAKKAKTIHPCIDVVRASALFLPFRSEGFDIATSFETLEHCSDLSLALEEIARVTKSRGLIVVSVPTTDLNDVYDDKSHIWHKSLSDWLDLFRQHFLILGVDYFMKFMRYVDGKTCSTFVSLKKNTDG